MKLLLFSFLILVCPDIYSQNIQLHWDLRHTIDPVVNPKNFPSFSFEYFKNTDSIRQGSFMLKLEYRLDGRNSNPGQVFTQVSQSFRFWKPKINLSVTYSGGLGVNSDFYGYYIPNSFGLGPAVTFQVEGTWIASSAYFRVNVFDRPSYDPQLTIWFGRNLFNYCVYVSGSFVFWTQNNNQGSEATMNLTGKKFAFFGDPQFWFKIKKGFSAGSKINVYYNLLNSRIQFYPSLGLKYQF
jgi:hypothetical protein